MSATETERPQAAYSLGHTPEEYERLRRQAGAWQAVTGRLLDQLGVGPGASCLDAGCGPGETMRLMAERVGPAGRVLGIDADANLGAMTLAMLHGDGYRQCSFRAQELVASEPIPAAPFDLVYARLLLFHLPQRVDVLARLWEAVAPGGVLLVQDYDVRVVRMLPEPDWAGEVMRVITESFAAAGADSSVGLRLPRLFAEAGAGAPDGTDVAGRLEPIATGRVILESTFRSLLPLALARGITTGAGAAATLGSIDREAASNPDLPVLWPLLVSAWKRKALA
ncbi:MAG TPA: methyltransferase domain-containing protein [Streptosporangiaceae bacterium]|jgi:SAM-dependent methyltransferase